jgi:hypothetical protein
MDRSQNQPRREVVEMAFEGRDFQRLAITMGGTVRGVPFKQYYYETNENIWFQRPDFAKIPAKR